MKKYIKLLLILFITVIALSMIFCSPPQNGKLIIQLTSASSDKGRDLYYKVYPEGADQTTVTPIAEGVEEINESGVVNATVKNSGGNEVTFMGGSKVDIHLFIDSEENGIEGTGDKKLDKTSIEINGNVTLGINWSEFINIGG